MTTIELSNRILLNETDDPNSICFDFIEISRRMICSKLKKSNIYRDDVYELAVDTWLLYAKRKKKEPSFRLTHPLSYIRLSILGILYDKKRVKEESMVSFEEIGEYEYEIEIS
jgi:hypothetical protein